MFRRKKIAIENNDRLFHEAIIAGNLEKVASLLESHPHLVNQINTKGDTALSIAVKGGHNGITDLLLKNGGNATHKDRDGTTLLMIACQQDNPVLVRMLLASPTVSATTINKRGKTAFSLALKSGNSYILQALEKKTNACRKKLKLAYVNQYIHDRSSEGTYTNKISRFLSFFHSHSKENKLAAANALNKIITQAIANNMTIANALAESNDDLIRDHGSQLNQGRLGEIYQSLRLG